MDRLVHNANPPVETSWSPPRTSERRPHPSIHQQDYKNPTDKNKVISRLLKTEQFSHLNHNNCICDFSISLITFAFVEATG